MSQQNLTDFPINPTVTSGTDLAQLLNRQQNAQVSSHLGATRPPYLSRGGLWAKEVSPTELDLYVYDGTKDVLIGIINNGNLQVSTGNTNVGGAAPTAPAVGDFWINTATKVVSWYNGASWDPVFNSVAYYTSAEVDAKIAAAVANYLPLTGGALTGPLTSTSTIDTDGAISSKADITAFKP